MQLSLERNATNHINCFIFMNSSPYVLIIILVSNKEDSTLKINCLPHDSYFTQLKEKKEAV